MPLHRSLGGSFHPARSRVRSVHVFGGDRDGGEDEPVSGGPANRDRRHVLQESSRSRFDRDVVDHPGALQHVRHRAAIVTDSEEPGGGPRELDVRALQTGRRIRPSERADDGLLNRSIGTFLCVTRRLDLDRGRRRFRVPRQADDDLLGLVGMAPELGARGRHRLGEPFERQPGSLLSTREQKARGLVRCIDFPVGDRQASGFLRAWHGSVSGTREATPPNIVRGIGRGAIGHQKSLAAIRSPGWNRPFETRRRFENRSCELCIPPQVGTRTGRSSRDRRSVRGRPRGPIHRGASPSLRPRPTAHRDRKSTRLNSSHRTISYADFCLKKKKTNKRNNNYIKKKKKTKNKKKN